MCFDENFKKEHGFHPLNRAALVEDLVPIRLAELSWGDGYVSHHVAKNILSELMGYKIEPVPCSGKIFFLTNFAENKWGVVVLIFLNKLKKKNKYTPLHPFEKVSAEKRGGS